MKKRKKKSDKARKKLSREDKQQFTFPEIFYVSAIFIILPLLFSSQTVEPVLMPRFFLLSLSLTIFLFFIFSPKRSNLRQPASTLLKQPIFLILFVFLGVNIISLFFAVNFSEGIVDILKIVLLIALIFFSSLLFLANSRLLETLSATITVLSFILCFLGICQYYGVAFTEIPGNFIIYATMANKNLLASALILMLPFIAYGLFVLSGQWRLFSIFCYIFSIFIIGIIHSRASWLAGAVIFISIALLPRFLPQMQISGEVAKTISRRAMLIVGVTILPVVATLFIHNYRTAQNIHLNQAITGGQVETSSISERLIMWQKSIAMTLNHPITGVGPGNWKIALNQYGTDGLRSGGGKVNYIRPHNDFLWTFAETGIAGGLLYLLIFALALMYGYKATRSSPDSNSRLAAYLISTGIVAYIVIAIFSFPKERIVHMSFLGLSISVLMAIYHQTSPVKKPVSSLWERLFFVGLIIGLLFSTWAGFSRVQSDFLTKEAIKSEKQQNWKRSISLLNEAETAIYNMDAMATPLALRRGLAWTKQLETDRDAIAKASAEFIAGEQVHPNHIILLNNLATTYERSGNIEQAISVYNRILEFSPHMEHTLINLTGVFIRQRQWQKAYDIIQKTDINSSNPRIRQYRELLREKIHSGEMPE